MVVEPWPESEVETDAPLVLLPLAVCPPLVPDASPLVLYVGGDEVDDVLGDEPAAHDDVVVGVVGAVAVALARPAAGAAAVVLVDAVGCNRVRGLPLRAAEVADAIHALAAQ